ncbi:MAG: carbohydrate porin [Candidatus Omnitrophota bacterium]
MRSGKIACWVFLFVFMVSPFCYAEDIDVQETLRTLEARIEALEKKVAEQETCIKSQDIAMEEQQEKITGYDSKFSQLDETLHRQTGSPVQLVEGFEIGAGGTMIVQGTGNVNDATSGAQKKVSRADASYTMDLTIGKTFEEASGKAFLHLEAGQGDGLEENLTLYSNVNRDADNDTRVRLSELWYEQGLFDRAVFTFGKLDPTVYFDNNEVANDETTQFLGRIFCVSPTIEFPDYAAGVRLAYMPVEWLELGYGAFDGDSDWEKVGDHLFNIGQVNFVTHFFDLPGNYRFYGWSNNVDHTKWEDTGKTNEDNYGFGFSFDQKATDLVTLFTRYGWQNPKVYNLSTMATGELNYSLEQSWSAGFQLEGEPWGREKDVLAFAVGQVFPSDDYKKAGGSLDPARKAETEGHLEAYYRIFVNDHLSVSPDLQYIWNPFGKDVSEDTSSIFVGGMRAQVDF